MKSFLALGLFCVIGVGVAADGADPTAPASETSTVSPQKVVAPSPGPVLTPGPVVTPADPWAEAMSAFANADNADAHAGGVVFVGSSSIRLWADLEKRYSSYSAVNRGFGGSTLADCVKHMDRLVLPHKPRLVVIYAGDNDLAGGRSPDQVLLDFVELTSRIQERLPKTQIVFVSIKPSPARIDLLSRIRDTNTKIRDYVATKPYLRYIDVFTPMLDAQGKPRGELFGGDSLHLNAEGYALWHALISPVLPTEEQPAMVKGIEPKTVSPAMQQAGSSPAEKLAVAKPASKPASKPANPPKAEPQKAVVTAADPKSAASPPPAVESDANATARAGAASPEGNADPAAAAAPASPDSTKSAGASTRFSGAAPSMQATPPTAAAEGNAAPAPAQDSESAAATPKAAGPAEASPSEIARLPPAPRTVRANVQPAHNVPVALPPPAPDGGGTDGATDSLSAPEGVTPQAEPGPS
jgi:lysophospholipase L1-like esterase